MSCDFYGTMIIPVGVNPKNFLMMNYFNINHTKPYSHETFWHKILR